MPHPVRPFPALALIGFLDQNSAVQFMSGSFLTRARTPAGMVRLWTRRQGAVARLAALSPADAPTVAAPDPSLAAYLASVEADPLFTATYQVGTWSFADVEIGKLLAFQPHVEVGRYDIDPGPAGLATAEQRARFTLPIGVAEPMVVMEETDGVGRAVAVTLSSSRPTMQFSGIQAQGQPGLYAFQVSPRPNFVAVVRYQGRYYLNNGYHRLVSLQRLGFGIATVVLRDVNTWGEVAPAGQGFFPEALMVGAPRPLLLRDFADAELAHAGRVRPFMTVLRVSYSEQRIPLV